MKTIFNWDLIPYALLIVSAGVNIWQRSSINTLQHNIEVIKSDGRLKVGNSYGPIRFVPPEGESQTAAFPRERETIVYFVSAQCGWCKRNHPVFRELVSQTSNRVDYIVLWSAKPAAADLDQYLIKGLVSQGTVTEDTQAAYRLGGTPTTIIISKEGKLIESISGAYSDAARAKLQALLGVQLKEEVRDKNSIAVHRN